MRVHPDGTAHRYYQFTGLDEAGALLASPDVIYFLASGSTPLIGHLSNAFVLTFAPVASALGDQFPRLVWSPDTISTT